MQNQIIKSKVQALWDRLWSGGLSNPITAIENISYLLFMKRLEIFKEGLLDEYKWSKYHHLSGQALVTKLNKVFDYIQNSLAEEDEPFARAMKQARFTLTDKPASLSKDAIKYIDEIYLEIDNEIELNNQHFQDIQGDLYEYLLKQTSEAGKNGQFRTPRHIIQLMASILDPDVDGKICDLASGSAGFLVGAYQHILTKYSKKISIDPIDKLPKGTDGKLFDEKENIGKLEKLKTTTFYGFDIDQTMVRIGMMNLMMHGITHPNIEDCDTLSLGYEKLVAEKLNLKLNVESEKSIQNKKLQGQFKYILANPPFTGKINSETVSVNLNRVYKPKIDKEGKRKKQTVQSELLFLERMVYMLEEGGKACVIVPEGVLFNSGRAHKATRQILMTDCDLEGVISLPSGVFQPYTTVKTSILIFKKRKYRNGLDKPQDVNVWFFGMESDGYSLDNNRKELKEKPLPIVLKEWKDRESKPQDDRKLDHFKIPYTEIEENGYELNFNLYKEFVYEKQNFKPSSDILKEIKLLEKSINEGIKELG
ncbi:class I SAM-dependent DNA methyltransferase [Tenacibaculum ovolyticum]|uniref:class I SAM-dependent DNA methyltransferase n=1 Tax=Tenacibaculum ovolyticum TaxID=104270 RepID=UPI0022F38E8B|nr:class I SAM-dependent DNA methyltransferase [Tenacibaculum ovolyticum]WBX74863.1 class I SAM-dependent DNA methyltransferase [Tenacibaculum ovolyticum]